jgi:hypothetical protein
MTIQSGRKLFVLWIVVGATLFARAASVHLEKYDCLITKVDSQNARVSAMIGLQGDTPGAALSIVIRQSKAEQLEKITVLTAEGQLLHPMLTQGASGTRLDLRGPGPWSLTYDVRSNLADLATIPLPVPSVPPLAESRAVHLSLRLPPSEIVFGDLFPNMKWRSPQEGYATMLSVPSLVIVHSKNAAEISLWEKLCTADNMANLSMLILLIFGLSRLGIYLFRRDQQKNTVEV